MTTTPTAGARVRIVAEGVVAQAEDGGITLSNRIAVEWTGNDAPTIEILAPGYQPGDVVRETSTHLGSRHLLRARIDGVDCWLDDGGNRVHDDEGSPESYELIARRTD